MKQVSDIGLIGLAVMGENLVLNMESKGFHVSVFNRTTQKVENFMNGRGKGKNIYGAMTLEDFIASLKRPRKVFLMVKAGQAVDDFIEKLIPLLDQNSKSAIFERILDGTMDYHFIKVLLPYAEYLTEQIEAAVVYGVLDAEVLKIVNRYYEEKEKNK